MPLTDRVGIARHSVRIQENTFTKKIKEKVLFAGTPRQSPVSLLKLINRGEDMRCAEPGKPEAERFDVKA